MRRLRFTRRAATLIAVGVVAGALVVASAASAATPVPKSIGNPTAAALCKKGKSPDSYKIGWETFSATQEWSADVTATLKGLAKKLGCVTIVANFDDGDGTKAVNNVRTMITQQIDGFVNCNVAQTSNITISKLLKTAGIPAVAICTDMPNVPFLNLSNYKQSYRAGQELVKAAKKRYPNQKTPYLLNAVCKICGQGGLDAGRGAADAFKKGYPGLPKSHIITIDHDSQEPLAYKNALSVLSLVPQGQLILTTANASDAVHGVYRAAKARKRTPLLAEDVGGSGFAMKLICKEPQYVGSISSRGDLYPTYFLPAVMEVINGTKLPARMIVPYTVYTKANDPEC